MKPPPTKHLSVQDFEEDSNSDENDSGTNILPSNHARSTNTYVQDSTYNPEFMEMDGKHDQKIKIPLTFSKGDKPENMANNSKYNDCVTSINNSALNKFKSP